MSQPTGSEPVNGDLCTWCSEYPPRFTLVSPWEVQEVCSIVCMEDVAEQWREHDRQQLPVVSE